MSESPANPLPRVIDFINRYVALPNEDQAMVLGLWVMHTWTFSEMVVNPNTTPYIYVHSPEKQSGKTRLIETLEPLVRNPMRATDMSPSVLFRAIEMMQPTILLDEVDAIWSGAKNEDMRGTLNGGYKRGGHVWRNAPGMTGGEDGEKSMGPVPVKFSTFSPKLLAGIDNGLLPDTIRDRSIPITLQRKRKDQTVAAFYSYDIVEETEEIVTMIEAWIQHHHIQMGEARPTPLTTISDRAWEITVPLIVMADRMGAKFGKSARKAVCALLAPSEATLSPGAQLLLDIRDLFDAREVDRIFTADIIAKLGGHWNGKLLGNRLRPYGIAARTIRVNNQTGKGFYRAEFMEIWERYL